MKRLIVENLLVKLLLIFTVCRDAETRWLVRREGTFLCGITIQITFTIFCSDARLKQNMLISVIFLWPGVLWVHASEADCWASLTWSQGKRQGKLFRRTRTPEPIRFNICISGGKRTVQKLWIELSMKAVRICDYLGLVLFRAPAKRIND